VQLYTFVAVDGVVVALHDEVIETDGVILGLEELDT
jgi:hypothetical protein